MSHFGNYHPEQWGWTHPAPIAVYTYKGVAFPGGVNRNTVKLWNHFLDELSAHVPAFHAGWCWGYDNRPIRNGVLPSFHSYGLALDINAPVNPYVEDGTPTAHEMPSIAGTIAKKYGMEWGGNWSRPKDYMHFEIHLSETEVADLVSRFEHHPPQTFEAYHHMNRSAYGSRNLKLWNAGDDVKFVQSWIGPSQCGPADGYFGPKTTNGVRWYQRMRGIGVDGIVGPLTWHQMEPR